MGTANQATQQARSEASLGRRRIAGFTLPELMISVAIVGILSAMAAPSFSGLIASQRTKTIATDIHIALAKARSEALKRNTNVTLSPKNGDWKAGWEILNPSDEAAKIEDHNAISGATIVGPEAVTYLTTGRVRGTTRPTFDITVSGSSTHACVTVDLSGLPTQKNSSC